MEQQKDGQFFKAILVFLILIIIRRLYVFYGTQILQIWHDKDY